MEKNFTFDPLAWADNSASSEQTTTDNEQAKAQATHGASVAAITKKSNSCSLARISLTRHRISLIQRHIRLIRNDIRLIRNDIRVRKKDSLCESFLPVFISVLLSSW